MSRSLREFIKSNAVRVPGGSALLLMLRKWRFARSLRRSAQTSQEIFTTCYRGKSWGDHESASGPGSTLEYTANLRRELPLLIRQRSVMRLLDAPCGDFHWMKTIRGELDCEYIGGDIVAELVSANQAQYADTRTRFVQVDISKDPLPAADLWLCRDVLFHLSEREVFMAIHNFLRSGIPAMLTSSHPECRYNSDIPTGAFRPLNLCLAPYEFPPPQIRIDDWIEGWPVRHMCLWQRSEVEQAMTRNRSYRRFVAQAAAKPGLQLPV